jgi:uncharacterized DUF497 family protein
MRMSRLPRRRIKLTTQTFPLTEQAGVENGEQRWQTLGIVEGHLLVLVAHTARDDDEDGQPIEVIRIISARRADRKERQRYEQETR